MPKSKAAEISRHARRVATALQRHGLLLLTDRAAPSVASLVAGGPVSGSWWAHDKGDLIYHVTLGIDEADALCCKLVDGKVTYVHRRLWSELLAVATSREAWQLDGLPTRARRVLDRVDAGESVRSDEILAKVEGKAGRAAIKKALGELERRVLCHVDQIHTDAGSHARVLLGWKRFTRAVGYRRRRLAASTGRRRIAEALVAACGADEAASRLPWPTGQAGEGLG